MNTFLINSVPAGEFSEISIHIPDWQTIFLKLIQEGRLIKYNVNAMPNLSDKIKGELIKQCYSDHILDSNHNQHFLIQIKSP